MYTYYTVIMHQFFKPKYSTVFTKIYAVNEVPFYSCAGLNLYTQLWFFMETLECLPYQQNISILHYPYERW